MAKPLALDLNLLEVSCIATFKTLAYSSRHIRAQFTVCGIRRVLAKIEAHKQELLDKQIQRLRTNEAINYEAMLEGIIAA